MKVHVDKSMTIVTLIVETLVKINPTVLSLTITKDSTQNTGRDQEMEHTLTRGETKLIQEGQTREQIEYDRFGLKDDEKGWYSGSTTYPDGNRCTLHCGDWSANT